MAKPIFIINAPHIDVEELEGLKKAISVFSDDYFTLIINENREDWKFQMFSDKEIEPIELQKLQELVNSK